MIRENFVIEYEDDKSVRVDQYLAGIIPEDLSRSQIQRLISEERVKVNGLSCRPNYRLHKGDRISCEYEIDSSGEEGPSPEEIDLNIVFEDDSVIVVDKPSGMVVHPACGNYSGTLVNALVYHSRKLSTVNSRFRPGIVHRLDKDTSGLLVIAKDDKAHRYLAKQFKNHSITRKYLGFVKGTVEFDNDTVDLPVGRSFADRKKMHVSHVGDGKRAVTHYRTIKRFEKYSLLEFKLETGRTHQIRVHMKHIGHPILGDPIYGDKDAHTRLALHAALLGFLHPVSKNYMEFESELPSDLEVLLP